MKNFALEGFSQSSKAELQRQSGKETLGRLLSLLQKAVGAIEEIYEKDFDLLHPDNALDYKEIIDALNDYGINYGGNKKILELAAALAVPEQGKKLQEIKPATEKLPMKKATGKKSEAKGLFRKSG